MLAQYIACLLLPPSCPLLFLPKSHRYMTWIPLPIHGYHQYKRSTTNYLSSMFLYLYANWVLAPSSKAFGTNSSRDPMLPKVIWLRRTWNWNWSGFPAPQFCCSTLISRVYALLMERKSPNGTFEPFFFGQSPTNIWKCIYLCNANAWAVRSSQSLGCTNVWNKSSDSFWIPIYRPSLNLA